MSEHTSDNYVRCLKIYGKGNICELRSIHLHSTRLSFETTSTTSRSDAGAILKQGDNKSHAV